MSLIEGKGRGGGGGDPTYEAPKAGAWHQRKASKNKKHAKAGLGGRGGTQIPLRHYKELKGKTKPFLPVPGIRA